MSTHSTSGQSGGGGGAWTVLADVDLSGGAAQSLSSGTIDAYPFLRILVFAQFSTNDNLGIRFNSDTAANYVARVEDNGALTSDTSANEIQIHTLQDTDPIQSVIDIQNVASGITKQANGITTSFSNAAANAIAHSTFSGLWANTSAQITEVAIRGTLGNNLTTNTRMIVLGAE